MADTIITEVKPTGHWYQNPDWWMVVLTLVLMMVGIITIFSFERQLREMRAQTNLIQEQLDASSDDAISSRRHTRQELHFLAEQVMALNKSVREEHNLTVQQNRSADIAQKSLGMIRENFVEQERPYVWILRVRPNSDLKENERTSWKIPLINFGKSPALDATGAFYVFVGQSARSRIESFFGVLKEPLSPLGGSKTVIAPGSRSDADPSYFVATSNDVVTSDDLKWILANNYGIVIVGRFEYRDATGTLHRTDFCQERSISGEVGACETHNEIQ